MKKNTRNSSESLPAFASAWVQQWKSAAPKLQAIRERELRQLGGGPDAPPRRRKLTHGEALENGLAIQQAWFVRQRLLQQTS